MIYILINDGAFIRNFYSGPHCINDNTFISSDSINIVNINIVNINIVNLFSLVNKEKPHGMRLYRPAPSILDDGSFVR